MREYAALRALSWFYIIVAGIILIGSILLGIGTMVTPSVEYNYATGGITRGDPMVATGIGFIISGVLASITLAAFGQLLQVILEMLQNSREQTKLLRVVARKSMIK